MRTKELLTVLSSVLLCSMAWAQSGDIKGQVFDTETGEPVPLANVHVEMNGALVGTTTDFDGRFILKPLNAGNYNVTVSYLGYHPLIVEGVRVNGDKITFLKNLQLKSSIADLPVAIVEAYRVPLIDPEDPHKMQLLAADIERRPNVKNAMALIAGMTSEIIQIDEGQPLYVRGSRSDAIIYFVDGMKTRDGNLGIPGVGIGGITVYTGGVPAKYGDVTGGVIVVETKSYFDLLNTRR